MEKLIVTQFLWIQNDTTSHSEIILPFTLHIFVPGETFVTKLHATLRQFLDNKT